MSAQRALDRHKAQLEEAKESARGRLESSEEGSPAWLDAYASLDHLSIELDALEIDPKPWLRMVGFYVTEEEES